MNYNFKDLTGQKFGRLTILNLEGKNKYGHAGWFCKCECGNTKIVLGNSLRSGNTKSCGCLKNELLDNGLLRRNTTHGMRKSSEYQSWIGMKTRCLNKNVSNYKYYGGRGITICKEWLKFENFYKDMGNKPSKKHSIDRVDNNGNYEKSNCRWATMKQQCGNRRNSVV